MRKPRPWLSQASFYLVATLVTLPFVVPLVWMVASSLRTPGLPPPRSVEWVPQPLAWGNYSAIFRMVPLARYIFNSLLVSGLAVVFTLLIASWAGFGMAQLGHRSRRRLLALSVGLLMVPVTPHG
jgi:ABC-type glycerol-3-phosphate transport system permease component